MYCTHCGTLLPDGVRFCSNCGKPVEQPQLSKQPGSAEPTQPEPTEPYQPAPNASAFRTPIEREDAAASQAESRQLALVILALVIAIVAGAFGLANGMFSRKDTTPSPAEQVVQDEQGTGEDAPSVETDVRVTSAVAEDTTPAGNLINGGYAASGDGWIFYAVPDSRDGWYTSAIGRMREDGSEKSVIYSASEPNPLVWHLNYLDGRLYFNEDINDSTASVVSIAIDGSDRQVIDACPPGTLCQVHRGVVYYVSFNGLTGYDPATGERWAFPGGMRTGELWRVWGYSDTGDRKTDDYAFFFEQGKGELYRDVWSGGAQVESRIVSATGSTIVNVCPSDDGVWLLLDNDGDGRGDQVALIDHEGRGTDLHFATSGPAVRINACNRGVFLVIKDSDSTRLELVTKTGSKPVVYYKGAAGESVGYPSVQGSLLLFGLGDTHRLVSVPLDNPGATPSPVA